MKKGNVITADGWKNKRRNCCYKRKSNKST